MGIITDEIEILELIVEQAGRTSPDHQPGTGTGLPGKLGKDDLRGEVIAVKMKIAKGMDEFSWLKIALLGQHMGQ